MRVVWQPAGRVYGEEAERCMSSKDWSGASWEGDGAAAAEAGMLRGASAPRRFPTGSRPETHAGARHEERQDAVDGHKLHHRHCHRPRELAQHPRGRGRRDWGVRGGGRRGAMALQIDETVRRHGDGNVGCARWMGVRTSCRRCCSACSWCTTARAARRAAATPPTAACLEIFLMQLMNLGSSFQLSAATCGCGTWRGAGGR